MTFSLCPLIFFYWLIFYFKLNSKIFMAILFLFSYCKQIFFNTPTIKAYNEKNCISASVILGVFCLFCLLLFSFYIVKKQSNFLVNSNLQAFQHFIIQ